MKREREDWFSASDMDWGQGRAFSFELKHAGAGTPIHFAHANGYPPLVYRQFLQALAAEHPVFGLATRASWPGRPLVPPSSYRWRDSAEDLIAYLDAQAKGPVIGMGHSLGGVITMFAAAKRPDLFKALVLIEPVFFSHRLVLATMATAALPKRLQSRNKLIRKTMGRPDCFDDEQACYDFHRSKWVFKGLSDESMWDYCHYGTTPDGRGQRRLLYPKAWEAHIYRTIPAVWWDLRKLKLPVMGVRGARAPTRCCLRCGAGGLGCAKATIWWSWKGSLIWRHSKPRSRLLASVCSGLRSLNSGMASSRSSL